MGRMEADVTNSEQMVRSDNWGREPGIKQQRYILYLGEPPCGIVIGLEMRPGEFEAIANSTDPTNRTPPQ